MWWPPPRPPSTPGFRAWRLPLGPLFLARVRLRNVDPQNKTTGYFFQQKGVYLGATPSPFLSPATAWACSGGPRRHVGRGALTGTTSARLRSCDFVSGTAVCGGVSSGTPS